MVTDAENKNCKLRLALIGLGNQGQEHLLGMQDSQHTTFVAGVDESALQRQNTQNRYPDLPLFDSLDALAQQAHALQIDGLVLCLPHHCYETVWPKVAALQLPVLKEKPLARNVEEARKLTAAIPSRKLKTAIQRRHHPSYRQLKQQLQADQAGIREISVWLHLGRKNHTIQGDWRGNQNHSGGGILLDAGYHLVDLVHFLTGPIELIHCTTWNNQQRCRPGEIEDAAQLLGRNANCWVMLDAQLGGNLDSTGNPQKSEGIRLLTSKGEYLADRTQVSKNGQVIWQSERSWQTAMSEQLDEFAQDIRSNQWNASTYWDQLPSMQLIEKAYQLAQQF